MGTCHKFIFLAMLSLLLAWSPETALAQGDPQNSEVIVVDAAAPTHPFPHFWEEMFGSGRAILSLRESYRNDLRSVKQITGLQYIRFHAISRTKWDCMTRMNMGIPFQLFLCGSDLRRTFGEWGAAFCRA